MRLYLPGELREQGWKVCVNVILALGSLPPIWEWDMGESDP